MRADRSLRGDFFKGNTVDKEAGEWRTYRTRFLIRARQLKKPMVFVDAMGCRQHGRRGDYLMEFATGLHRIVPRRLFEDVYVPMDPGSAPESANVAPPRPEEAGSARRTGKKAGSSVQNRRSSPASQPLIA